MKVESNRISGILLSLLFLVWFTIACSSNSLRATSTLVQDRNTRTNTVLETITPSTVLSTITPMQTSTPSPTLVTNPSTTTPSPTLGATLTTEQRQAYIVDLMINNADCQLPCFWGFVSGDTKWKDAELKFRLLGDSVFSVNEGKGSYRYDVELQNFRDEINLLASFYVRNDIIVWITSEQIVYSGSSRLREFEQALSIKSFLTQYGKPDRIKIDLGIAQNDHPDVTHYAMSLYYDQAGFMFWTDGLAIKEEPVYKICPNRSFDRAEFDPLRVAYAIKSLDNESSLDELEEKLWGQQTYRLFDYVPLEKASGLEIDDFLSLVTEGDVSACFTVKMDLWP